MKNRIGTGAGARYRSLSILLALVIFLPGCLLEPGSARRQRLSHGQATHGSGVAGSWGGQGIELIVEEDGSALVRYDCGSGTLILDPHAQAHGSELQGHGVEFFADPSIPRPEPIPVLYRSLIVSEGIMELTVIEKESGIATPYRLEQDRVPSFAPPSACPGRT